MFFNLENRASREAREAKTLTLATLPGAQRVFALEALAKIGSDPAFSLAFGPKLVAVTGSGKLVKSESGLDASDPAYEARAAQFEQYLEDSSKVSYMNPVLESSLVPGSAGLNKMVGSFPVLSGVCVIVAGSGAGKTPLAHALAQHGVDDYATVRVGEPFAGYTSSSVSAAAGMAMAAVASQNVVVDSIKDLLGAGGGGTAKGGVSRVALSMLSHWSALGAALGCTFYIPLNPSTGDEETTKMLIEAAKSSATTTVYLEGASWKYTVRPGEGMERINGTIDKSIMSQNSVNDPVRRGSVHNADGRLTDAFVNNLSSDALVGIIQRSTFAKVK